MHEISILGARVHLVQPQEARDVVLKWFAESRRFHYISSTNINTLINAVENTYFREVTNAADLSVPDGMPIVWYSRYLGYAMPKKCGIEELMHEIFALSSQGYAFKHYFYGNTEDVLKDLVENLLKIYPNLKIVDTCSPPFCALTKEEQDQTIDQINATQPDFLWVSLGCPKQEIWLYEHRHQLNAVAGGGAGAVFNFLARRSIIAPSWIKYAGLEWLLRLLIEPRRLYKRYLIKYPKFFWIWFASMEWWKQRARQHT